MARGVASKCYLCNNTHYGDEKFIGTIENLCYKCRVKLKAFEESFTKRIKAHHHSKALGRCSWGEFKVTLLRNKLRCYYSNKELTVDNYSIDHLHPTSDYERSSTTPPNLLPVLKGINGSKGDKDFIEWYTDKLPYYSEARKKYILDKHYYKALETRQQAKDEEEAHRKMLEERARKEKKERRDKRIEGEGQAKSLEAPIIAPKKREEVKPLTEYQERYLKALARFRGESQTKYLGIDSVFDTPFIDGAEVIKINKKEYELLSPLGDITPIYINKMTSKGGLL